MNVPMTATEGLTLTVPLFNAPMRAETGTGTRLGSWMLGVVGPRPDRFRKVCLGSAELEDRNEGVQA